MITWCIEPWAVTIGALDDKEDIALMKKLYERMGPITAGPLDPTEVEVTADADDAFALAFYIDV